MNTANSLRAILGCAGLAIAFWAMPTSALAASCGPSPYASGPHALSAAGRASARFAPAGGQSATAESHDRSIVGLWHTVYTFITGGTPGTTAWEAFDQWHQDGNEFEAADLQLGAMCQGTWVYTGSGEIRLFHVGWNFDPTGITLVGYFTEIQTATVSDDGMSYEGNWALQNFDTLGNHLAGLDQSGTVHATRLTVH